MVSGILGLLGSVLSQDTDDTFTIHHQSFVDFLTYSEHCPDQFFIDRQEHSCRLTFMCLHNMNDEEKGLKFNICQFPTSHASNDSVSVPEEPIRRIRYSCQFWADHLRDTEFDSEIHGLIEKLLHSHLLHWLEVLSMTKEVRSAIRSLEIAIGWLKVSY